MREPVRRVRFGPFEADLATGELWRGGVRVPLQQQPFRVLKALLAQPGELVTRDELRRTLWAEGTFVAFERGVISAMRKVREALGDRADAPMYIETLPGRGYRFIAPVSVVTPAVAPGVAAVVPAPVVPAPVVPAPRRWRTAAAAAVLLTAIAGQRSPEPRDADGRLAAALSLSEYACALKSDGRAAEALAVIRQAHDLAPESARITAEVGFYAHAAGEYEAEFPMLRRAVAQDARSVDAWLHLGLAHARRLEFDAAIAALERARALDPGHGGVRGWLDWARQQRASV